MAYVTIPTRTTTDPNSSADINQLMDNDTYLLSQIGGGVTTIDNTQLEVLLSGSQAIPNGGFYRVNFDNIVADALGDWDATNKAFVPTIPAGETYYYLVTYAVEYTTGFAVGTASFLIVYKSATPGSGGSIVRQRGSNSPTASWPGTRDYSTVIALTPGDTLYFSVYQSSGGSRTLNPNVKSTSVSIARLSGKDVQ